MHVRNIKFIETSNIRTMLEIDTICFQFFSIYILFDRLFLQNKWAIFLLIRILYTIPALQGYNE